MMKRDDVLFALRERIKAVEVRHPRFAECFFRTIPFRCELVDRLDCVRRLNDVDAELGRASVFGLLREEVLEMSLESLQGDVEAFRSECLDVMVVLARAYAEAERFVGQTKEGQKDE